ncbi:MAG: hypothetical protein R3C61_11840 [Bacteroidia bacterium]
MRNLLLSFCLFSVILWSGCGPLPTIVSVQVVNSDSQQPLDSANVILYRYYDRDYLTPIDSQWTTAEGTADFRFIAEEGYQYLVDANRKFFQPVLNENGATFDNQLEIVAEDTNTAVLLLELIPPPDPVIYATIHPAVPVNQIIGALATDTWEWMFLPKLYWEDIPALYWQGATAVLYTITHAAHRVRIGQIV